jgi:hypothetical protein
MPKLADQEKSDIQRYLDADKPLPERYRFLLFDDNREVERVWNGETAEVCNVVLPVQASSMLMSRALRSRRRLKGWAGRSAGRANTSSRTNGRGSARSGTARWN